MSSLEDSPLSLAALRRSRGARYGRNLTAQEPLPGLFDAQPPAGTEGPAETERRGPDEPVTSPHQQQPLPRHNGSASLLEVRSVSEVQTTSFAAPPPASILPSRSPSLDPGAVRSVAPSLSPSIWTVSALVQQVRAMVEGSYRSVWVEGEISNWRPAASGHCYFTLKDGSSQLSAVLFRKQAILLRFRPKDGDTVRLRGQLSIYESRGQMQLIGDIMEQVGLGALLAATRELRERLRAEGLFDSKRPLPAFPRCIGVVTSPQGAALRDIVKVCRRRHAAVNLLVYPVAVQGSACALQVAQALRWFSQHPGRVDVVLVARGGGSWEDLHGFDDEAVARAIVACVLPVISGIGHAIDSTIADAAADVCAPTPSAAAELLTAAQHRVEEQVARLRARLLHAGRFDLLRARQRLAGFGTDGMLRRVERVLGRRAQRLDELVLRLREAEGKLLNRRAVRLLRAEACLRSASPVLRLASLRERTGRAAAGLGRVAGELTETRHRRLEHAAGRLVALSPLRVLDRGYALVYGPGGHLLRSAGEVRSGEPITARLANGSLRARVEADG